MATYKREFGITLKQAKESCKFLPRPGTIRLIKTDIVAVTNTFGPRPYKQRHKREIWLINRSGKFTLEGLISPTSIKRKLQWNPLIIE